MRHELKTWPKFYSMVESGRKRFEIRRDDREFAIGDTLVLREYDANADAYTGKSLERTVADIISLRPLYEAVALVFCWHGDSTESTLRAELAAARERLEKAEAQLAAVHEDCRDDLKVKDRLPKSPAVLDPDSPPSPPLPGQVG